MIIPRKKAAEPSAPRSPDLLTLSSPAGWDCGSGDENSALRVSSVYRCVAYNSDMISIMPFYIMDRHTRVRIDKHPLHEVLTIRPNEAMSPTVYRKLLEVRRLLRGNAYTYIRRDPRTGHIDELLPLDPDLVMLHWDDSRHLHYLYTDPISGRIYDLLPSDLCHYKAFTLDGFRGITPLKYAREVIAKDRAAKGYERALYNNGGRPSGILYTDSDLGGMATTRDADGNEIQVSKKELVRRAWERVHSGSDNAFRTAVLDLGLKYQPIAMNNADAQFVESNDITIADVARFFGTPLHVLMSGKQSYESNVQNRVEFVQTTALAAVSAFEDEDSYKLLSLSDQAGSLRVRRNMDAALRGDTKSRAEFYETMQRVGAYSPNDILALEDRPDVPGGDARMASLNYVPLEDFRRLSNQRNGG